MSANKEAAAVTQQDLRGQHGLRGYLGDLAGGFTATLIAIPHAMGLGLLAFAALGPSYAATGVMAGLLSSVVGSFVAGAIPAVPGQMMGARTSTTVVFAGILAVLATHPLL